MILYIAAELTSDGEESGFVKIGVTKDEKSLRCREMNLATGNPRPIEMRWTWTFHKPGEAYKVEQSVLQIMSFCRMPDKEWLDLFWNRPDQVTPSDYLMSIVDNIIADRGLAQCHILYET